MITIFENFNEPDLREIGEFVKCIKSYRKLKKNNIYKIKGMRGDPQGAIEKFGINDYVPVECISMIEIDEDNIGPSHKIYKFGVNYKYYKNFSHLPHFFDYFELMEESTIAKKYNL